MLFFALSRLAITRATQQPNVGDNPFGNALINSEKNITVPSNPFIKKK